MKKIVLFCMTCGILFAGGYKIPEISLNSVALSAANIAHVKSADAAYYNPANMVFMENKNFFEAALTYIGLEDINYKGSYISTSGTTSGYDIDSKKEHFLIPSFNFVSKDMDGVRFGLCVVSPLGLSKRWDEAPAIYTAEEFTLKTVEVNPSIAFALSSNVSAAIGIRAIYSEGTVKSVSPIAYRDMSGDSLDLGYNLALSYRPVSKAELALTYRSNIDLGINGDAVLFFRDMTNMFGNGVGTSYGSNSSASVSVPSPASFSFAAAYTFDSETTVELVYERNFWHSYSRLDFDYGATVDPAANTIFGAAIRKDYKDTNVFRLGITQKLDKLTLMGGMVIDKTPLPSSTLGFELPDSDSVSVSFGSRYQISDTLNIGLGALYSIREDREILNGSIDGKFTNMNVLLISTAIEYRF